MKKIRNISTNIIANIGLQITTILCGLIIPRLIITTYGSEINGMITSITQFLGYITLLEAGMGSVVKAALYKPLANRDSTAVSGIVQATNNFFRRIAYIFVIYLIVLAIFYQNIAHTNFDFMFSFSLVLILGISTFIQYYFGITYQILLQADQKIWLTSGLQILTLVINTIFTFVLIKLHCSIHLVKITTAFIFAIRPIVYSIYVKKYKLNNKTKKDNYSISQIWDGLGHHLAYFIHTNTDIALLTIFVGLRKYQYIQFFLWL